MSSQDYKNRNKNRRTPSQPSGGAFKWMLITGLLIGVVVFAVYLIKGSGLKKLKHQLQNPVVAPLLNQVLESKSTTEPTTLSAEMVSQLEQQPEIALPPEAANELEHEVPQFDFYTMLPEKELTEPEREIMTKPIAEKIAVPVVIPNDSTNVVTATTKQTLSYVMQAGSFKNSIDAEKMRTNLEAMGIEARVERAKVGETVWHRIKMGPYTQMSSVTNIRSRLRQSGIDVIVTETVGIR